MPSARELGRVGMLEDIHAVRKLEVEAVTGKPRANGTYTLVGDSANGDGPLPDNKVYVRLDSNPQEVLEVFNASGIARRVNIPVRVKKDAAGDWRIIGLNDKPVSNQLGKNAPMLAQPPVDSEAADFKLAGKDYKPGSLVKAVASSIKVRVRPFFYRYFDSVKYWPGTAYLDLTAYLPVTSSYWAWVWVGVDPITETLTAVTGTEFANKTSLTITELVTADMTGIVPSDAIKVQQGISDITTDHEIAYARQIVELSNTTPSNVGTARVGSGHAYQFYNSVTFSGEFTVDGEIRFAA